MMLCLLTASLTRKQHQAGTSCEKSMLLEWLSNDGKLIISARILRAFAYGLLSVILAIYLRLIGVSDLAIGFVLTATLANSIIFTLVASFYADRIGRRKILILYGALMSIAGSNFVPLILAALIGTINVTGSETGAFISIEQALLPQTVTDTKKRNTIFAIYNMVGTFAMAIGTLVTGLPSFLQQQYGLTQVDSIKPLFLLYSALGIATIVIYLFLSKKIEVSSSAYVSKPLTKTLSPPSKRIVGKLSGLFAVDSFAGGFVIQSLVSFWFYTRFGVEFATLSYIFSVAGVLTALSFLAAARIADRIGLVNTMVFTHIPSNLLLIMVGFAPNLPFAIGFYLARMALSQMDVPTRQSYIVAVVNEDERTAAAGITNISRNISQAISPSVTGAILQLLPAMSTPFVIGGALKIIYDLALYFSFRNIKPEQEQ
jgi:MFS family permease